MRITNRQIFRIGTVRCAEGLWRMPRHGPVIAHCTDVEDSLIIITSNIKPFFCTAYCSKNVCWRSRQVPVPKCQQDTSTLVPNILAPLWWCRKVLGLKCL